MTRTLTGRLATVRALVLFTLFVSATVVACRDITRPQAVIRQPGKPTHLLNPSGVVTAYPGNMQGWVFYDDQHDTVCTVVSLCGLVSGPATPPAGSGSAELATSSATDGKALVLPDYGGVRFDQITALRYSTYRQSVDSSNNLAIALQFNVDYDLTDTSTTYQGRIVFEPYRANGGQVVQNAWQRWDALAGKWWGTKSTVMKGGAPVANPCVQASPCTWPQLLSAFPDIGVHPTLGAVVLKAGSGWPGFRGDVDQLTISIGTASTTFDFEAVAPPVVTPLPPATTPTFAPGGLIDGSALSRDSVQRGTVLVEFYEGTTQAQRQAAINLVHGSVVGGLPVIGGDGYYVVQLGDSTADATAIGNALDSLNALPQVEVEMPIEVDVDNSSYRHPYDGDPDFRTWQLDPTLADGKNWALERVRAPWAWGCSTGTQSTNIGIVDIGLDTLTANATAATVPDLQKNTAYLNTELGADRGLKVHGREVASVLAAHGNDSTGMTGMMWNAGLILEDETTDPRADPQHANQRYPRMFAGHDSHVDDFLQQHIVNVGLRGAAIINLSFNHNWQDSVEAKHPPTKTNRAQVRVITENRALIAGALRRLSARGYQPLLVFSAGNWKLDAFWGGYNDAEKDFPNQVITVGGSDQSNNVWDAGDGIGGSNTGADYVDLYAPATGVGVLDVAKSASGVTTADGTSMAAPLVAGVAGLLKSFDPSLTSGQLKQLIMDGATRHGIRVADGKYLLDAYEALRGAAMRPNAPLCGNRVWYDADSVSVERMPGQHEVIIHGAPQGMTVLAAYHGGKRIDINLNREWVWTNGIWGPTGYTDAPNSEPGGAYWSYEQFDHDTKQSVGGRIGKDLTANGKDTATITFVDSAGTPHVFTNLFAETRSVTKQCVADTVSFVNDTVFNGILCADSQPVGTWDGATNTSDADGSGPLFPVLSPQADFILVPIVMVHRARSLAGLFICDRFPYTQPGAHDYCGSGPFTDSSTSLTIYKINISTQSWTPIPLDAQGDTTRNSGDVEWLSVSEAGDQVMFGYGNFVQKGGIQWITEGGAGSEVALSFTCANARDEWLNLVSRPDTAAGATLFSVPRTDPAPCDGSVEAGSSVSPNRRPLVPLFAQPSSSSRKPKPPMKRP